MIHHSDQAVALLQTTDEGGTTGFSAWTILLLVSAVFWIFVARAIKRRLDAMDDVPTPYDEAPVNSTDD